MPTYVAGGGGTASVAGGSFGSVRPPVALPSAVVDPTATVSITLLAPRVSSANSTSAGHTSITSASFTPAAGTRIFACCGANHPGTGQVVTPTVSGGGLTWTKLRQMSNGSNSGTNGMAAVFYADVVTPAPMTVNLDVANTSGGGASGYDASLVLLGALNASTSAPPVTSSTSPSGTPTVTMTVAAGSVLLGVASDWSAVAAATAGVGTTVIDSYTNTGQIDIHTFRSASSLGSGSQTISVTPATQNYNLVGVEIQLATVSGSAFSDVGTLSGDGALTAVQTSATAVGAAGLSGDGSLAAPGIPKPVQAAGLSGSGSLGAATIPKPAQAAGLSGDGTLAAAGVPKPAQAAGLSGTGTLTTTAAVLSASGAAGLAGSGTLAAPGTPAVSSGASLTGSGTLGAAATSSGAGFAGTGTLVAVGKLATSVSVALAGSGTLTDIVAMSVNVLAALAGTGTLASPGIPSFPVGATLSGTGTLTVPGIPRFPVGAALSGAGTLAAVFTEALVVGATLSGSGQLSAFRSVQLAALSGSGSLVIQIALPTPPERRIIVPHEDRRVIVPAGYRRTSVPAEDRRLVVPAENRTVEVPRGSA